MILTKDKINNNLYVKCVMKKRFIFISLALLITACTSKEEKMANFVKEIESKMVKVDGGAFLMGNPWAINVQDKYGYNILKTPENEKKYPDAQWFPIASTIRANSFRHKVRLDTFYISKYETTWEEFDRYSKIIGKELKFPISIKNKTPYRNANMPVRATWQEATEYCSFLAKHSGKKFDLVTEAQWEYAARSRGKFVYFATDTGRGVSNRDSINPTHEPQNLADDLSAVGSFPPNPLGLYDMSGNQDEWVNDWYEEDYYKHSPVDNPKGPKSGKFKVYRGGGGYGAYDTVFDRFKSDIYKFSKGYEPALTFRCVINTN